ncbi:hypothetical protein G6F57_005855 [Rhizopus arrhizus]|nr:hypothetical protein G6F24_005620 [Rhizopus arrhizus]KAG1423195.1 hypothetical protein G6F58_002927 [Rhizopus delemar]KAG0913722.1 hypothetical protein G6F33_004908 [Rhizopus arrhizus]KAG0939816.1 hypothetical protein G6F30_007066 [Rhizopus arrhizus]KAG0981934.1 hypothetical protein G6F29_006682 [Rhizopus arrhizus]
MTTSVNELTRQPQKQRSKRIELVIIPGRSLGPFKLGSSLWDNLNFLLDKSQFFPSVELKYSQEEPLEYDFIVALPNSGLNLRYDGSLQRLKSIECYDPSKGLAFTFPIPTKHQDLYKSSTDLPLEFPDGTTPIASKVVLYSNSNTWQEASVPSLPKVIAESNASTSIKYGKLERREVESVIAKPTKGVTLVFPAANHIGTRDNNANSHHDTINAESDNIINPDNSNNTTNTFIHNRTVFIHLNVSTPQDILAELGKPSRIFYKEEDKMKIHSVNDHNSTLHASQHHPFELNTNDATVAATTLLDDKGIQPTDYFFNYFYLGIDILMDGALHVCKKIILHGNIPGHYDFQKYKRCPFQIQFSKKKNKKNKLNNASLLVDVEDDNEEIITADMKISTMQERIPWDCSNTIKEDGPKKPVILTRGSSEQNPFGSTYLTGYDEGIVMEVMKNGYVPTVVLF